MPNGSRFWAFDWFDASGIRSLSDAAKALDSPTAVSTLRLSAEQGKTKAFVASSDEYSVVAGRGIDLSGQLDCNAPECRQRQVDVLFRHAWHYFDRIVVADAISHEVTMHWDAPKADLKKWLLSHIAVLLYLRDIGAEDLVVFREKPPACEEHWQQHAHEAGLGALLKAEDFLVTELIKRAKVDAHMKADGSFRFAFTHPDFEHTVWGGFAGFDPSSGEQPEQAAAKAVLRRYVANLTSDVATAKATGIPLGSTIWLHGKLLGEARKVVSPGEVALHMNLPVLEGLSVASLLKIRSDERDAFIRFRAALRKAIVERVKVGKSTSAPALAEEIGRDLIDPALAGIAQRLKTASRMLNRKAAVGVELGGLATVCGLLAGISLPVAAAAGVGALVSVVGSALTKDTEERRDVSLSEMYFLWKAVGHSTHKETGGA